MQTITRILLLVGLLLVIAGCDSSAPQATPTAIPGAGGTGGEPTGGLGADLQGLIAGPLTVIDQAMLTNDVEKARTAFKELDTTWTRVEAAVKAASPDEYTKIKEARDKLEAELVTATTPNVVGVAGAVGTLRSTLRAFIATLGSNS